MVKRSKVKLLHFSDFHNGYENLDRLIEYANSRHDVDAVVFSGDILGPLLNSKEASQAHKYLETIVQKASQKFKIPLELKDALKYAKRGENLELKKMFKEYRTIEKKFDKLVKAHYKEFKGKIKKFRKKVFMIPGNWDTPMFKKIFRGYNIHKKKRKINGVRIAGFGGANAYPRQNLATRYFSYDGNEYGKYLKKHKPHIMLSHMPPKGSTDGRAKIGSETLADYLNENHKKSERKSLKVVACGHAHGYDSVDTNGVKVVNAGNFGKYFNSKGHGTFAEISIDYDNRVDSKHYAIQKGLIYQLGDKGDKVKKPRQRKAA